SVSRHHARFDVGAGGVSVVDLGSANGTTVNGAELEPRIPRALAAGAAVTIGSYSLVLRLPRPDAPPPRPGPMGEGRTRLRQTMMYYATTSPWTARRRSRTGAITTTTSRSTIRWCRRSTPA